MCYSKKILLMFVSIFAFSLCSVILATAQTSTRDQMKHKEQYNDKTFLSAMVAHSRATIEIADLVLKSGKDPQVKKWAEAIKIVQLENIERMSALLIALGGVDQKAEQEMKDSMKELLTNPVSQNPDINFVSMMIDNNGMAIDMSVPAVVYSKNDKVVQLANWAIKADLQAILSYKAWLAKNTQ
ncbi:DUF305 domain-containing protein [Desulfovibrio litoralis]|uniref:Uncharacterized conserved protein, DUF305 family n=1 Tax=Desulfovibrio litoralis DSM 11393 TaxID=1121455 RepID=A0A1M7TMV8_9BACT|nr:DUF305 domain-containing protein [Desulfovibrio litoralis]SHN71978.1 Uncharacterized conserved protein, DUF305 family [Desulfovibrio litoralis DSM 11393]